MPLINQTFSQLITFTRASSGTFTGPNGLIQSANTNVPRFDYAPVTIAARGLLIEEQRTNLLTYSEQFDNAIWVKDASATVTPNTYISPAGTLTADTLNCFAYGDSTYQLINLTSGITYTGSVYVKYVSGGTDFRIQIGGSSFGGDQNITFNSQTGALVSNPNSLVYSVANVGNDWYRIAVSRTATATGNSYWDLNANTAAQFAVWGAQLEAGSFATSYIPTVASQVTRSADLASVNTLSPWYNATEGTLYAEVTPYGVAANTLITSFDDGSSANRILIWGTSSGSATRYEVRAGAVTQVNDSVASTLIANATTKAAAAYKVNDFAFSVNGSAAVLDGTGTVPAVNKLNIGGITGASFPTGAIRRITYYPRRLSNAELVSITA